MRRLQSLSYRQLVAATPFKPTMCRTITKAVEFLLQGACGSSKYSRLPPKQCSHQQDSPPTCTSMLLAALHGHAWIGGSEMQLAGPGAVLQATGELLRQCCLRRQARQQQRHCTRIFNAAPAVSLVQPLGRPTIF